MLPSMRFVVGVAGVLVVGACASHPPPSEAPKPAVETASVPERRPTPVANKRPVAQPPVASCDDLGKQVVRRLDRAEFFVARAVIADMNKRTCGRAGALQARLVRELRAHVTAKPSFADRKRLFGQRHYRCGLRTLAVECGRRLEAACRPIVRDAALTATSVVVHRLAWHAARSTGDGADYWVAGQRCAAKLFPTRSIDRTLEMVARLARMGRFEHVDTCVARCRVPRNTRFHLRLVSGGKLRLAYIVKVNKFLLGTINQVGSLGQLTDIFARIDQQRHHINKLDRSLSAAGRRESANLDRMLLVIRRVVRRLLPPVLDARLDELRRVGGAKQVDGARSIMRRYGHYLTTPVRKRYNAKFGAAIRAWLRKSRKP